jgi:hypothetical protein
MALDFPNSPATGQQFTGPNGIVWQWDGTKWIVSGGGTVFQSITGDVGRNLLHNGLFNVAQRGAGPFTSGYTADRWPVGATTSLNVQIGPPSDANRADIGDEAATSLLSCTFTGGAAATDFIQVVQHIENLRRLAGKTVTVSFYANAGTASMRIGISLDQHFGSGGSPSADVNGNGQAVTLSATAAQFARYSATFAIPSAAGKTLGTNSDNYTALNLWLSAGSNFAARSGIGVQSGVVNFWGVQLEIGTVATPLEKIDAQQDLAKCQRFYQVASIYAVAYNTAGSGLFASMGLPVTMRANPTVTLGTISDTNLTTPNAAALSASSIYANGTVSTTGSATMLRQNMTLSADL